jgi:hypothetical protein
MELTDLGDRLAQSFPVQYDRLVKVTVNASMHKADI